MSPLDKEGSSWSLKSLSYFHRSNSGSDQEAALGSRASLAGSTTGLMVDQEKQQAKIDFYNQRHGSSDGGFIDNLKKNWFGFLMMITLMALFIAGMIVVLTSTDVRSHIFLSHTSIFRKLLTLIVILKQAEDICATDACIKKAQTFLTAFNTTVNPCDDFYEFTCGAHIKATGALNELELVAEANKVDLFLAFCV